MSETSETNKEASVHTASPSDEAWALHVIELAKRTPSTPEEADQFLDEFWTTLMRTD